VRALQQGQTGERYILGGDNVSYRQIAEAAALALGVDKPRLAIPYPVTWLAATLMEPVGQLTGKRPRFTYDVHFFANHFQYYTSAKAERELGYCPRPFAEIVREYLAWKPEPEPATNREREHLDNA
jgi:dihydroflavonol-4-reductase